MIGVRPAPMAQAILLSTGLALALALRVSIPGGSESDSVAAGLTFAEALTALALASGWRPGQRTLASAPWGALGALVLIAGAVWSHRASGLTPPAVPLTAWSVWATVVTAVAIAEELILRGVLFSSLMRAYGPGVALLWTTTAFGLLHVPLYGWHALPLDLAVGLWLGVLRLVSGSVTAPAIAHVLADLAAWWLW